MRITSEPLNARVKSWRYLESMTVERTKFKEKKKKAVVFNLPYKSSPFSTSLCKNEVSFTQKMHFSSLLPPILTATAP